MNQELVPNTDDVLQREVQHTSNMVHIASFFCMFVVVVCLFVFCLFFFGGGGGRGGIPFCQVSSTGLPSFISPFSSSSIAVRHKSSSSDPVQGRERATGGAVFPGCHASTYGGSGH